MSDVYDEQELADRTEEFLEHFGVKGMKWGVKKAANSTVGRIATAPARQGIKNAKTLGGAIGRANARQKVREENYVKKHGEIGAHLRNGVKHVGAQVIVAKASKMLMKDLKGRPNAQANVFAAQLVLQGGLLVSQISKSQRIDNAANRVNAQRGAPQNTYIPRGTR